MKKFIAVVLIAALSTISLFAQTNWSILNTIDDFGDATDNKVLIVSGTGTFDNSVYTGRYLKWVLRFEDYKGYCITEVKLLEYGDVLVVGGYEGTKYNVAIKTDDGTISNFTWTLDHGSDWIISFDTTLVEALLEGNTKVKVVMTEVTDYVPDKYYFTIEQGDFLSKFIEAFSD